MINIFSFSLTAIFAVPLVVALSQQQALALCSGSNCNGVDPAASGCADDAITVAKNSDRWTTVEQRYSPACNANWVRATTPIFSTLYLLDSGGRRYVDYPLTVQGQGYTSMWDGNIQYKACVDRPFPIGTICTEKFI